ncbi:MAG: uracil-DNA glycosylase [Verrucomicrobia bacterium]|nr:uracil-DNA glycosylase [Verrucomicrobiota bacterium]
MLLDWTIGHLNELKEQGHRFVHVHSETLAALRRQPAPDPHWTSQAAARSSAQQSEPADGAPLPAVSAGAAPDPAQAVQSTLAQAPIQVAGESAGGWELRGAGGTGGGRSREEKAAAFEALRKRVLACVRCRNLAAARRHVVFGAGDIDAALMFVGEAPGMEEDQQGEPFVGAAGQLLTKILQAMGLDRQSVYIGNILKCRPDTPGQSSGNRKPTPSEMQTCVPFLEEQIDLIGPKVLVALGATAVEGLLGKTVGITRLRGHWQTYRGIPLMPTFHPAYLLYNQARTERRKFWEDMLQVMERLQMPISKKQRAYFSAEGPFLTRR